MPLKLSLKPGEAVIVNGAVLRNGDRRGTMLLENQSRVLREKDVMQPESVSHPAQRAYFAIMQLYLVGEIEGSLYDQAASALGSVIATAETEDQRALALEVATLCASGDIYKALSVCRRLMKECEPRGMPDA